MKELGRTQAKEKIEEFFRNIDNKNKEEIKKIKKLAMHYHIRLGDSRKKFCKYCYSTELKTRKITKDKKTFECKNCKRLMRWKIR